MSKPLLFYAIYEFTDNIKYCKKKGLIPYKFKELTTKIPGDTIIKKPIQYIKDDYYYDVLEKEACYSECEVILMRLPKLSYKELLNVAVNSKYSDERIGAIAIILKDYPKQFKESLLLMSNEGITKLGNKKNIKRMSKYVYDLIKDSWLREELENIMILCGKLGGKT